MSRASDGLHIYTVTILSVSRGPVRYTVHSCDRYVVAGLHRGGALPRFAVVSWYQRVQSDNTDCGAVGVRGSPVLFE